MPPRAAKRGGASADKDKPLERATSRLASTAAKALSIACDNSKHPLLITEIEGAVEDCAVVIARAIEDCVSESGAGQKPGVWTALGEGHLRELVVLFAMSLRESWGTRHPAAGRRVSQPCRRLGEGRVVLAVTCSCFKHLDRQAADRAGKHAQEVGRF